jgi:hypothetical protein
LIVLNSQSAGDFERFLTAEMKTIFSNLGFRVSDFAFDSLIQDSGFRKKLREDFDDSPGAQVLLFSPDLFVMHNKLKPENSAFFVKCLASLKEDRRSVNLSPEQVEVYRRFYPLDRILAVAGVQSRQMEVLAGWMSRLKWRKSHGSAIASVSPLSPLKEFLMRAFRMKLESKIMDALLDDLVKTSR